MTTSGTGNPVKIDDRSVIIPPRVLNAPPDGVAIINRLTGGELKVYIQILRRANRDGMTKITLATLARLGGNGKPLTRVGLRKILNGLEEKGALRKGFKPKGFEHLLGPDWPKNTWIFET